MQGNSRLPGGKSVEHFLTPVIVHTIEPLHRTNIEQRQDMVCPGLCSPGILVNVIYTRERNYVLRWNKDIHKQSEMILKALIEQFKPKRTAMPEPLQVLISCTQREPFAGVCEIKIAKVVR